MTHVNRFLSRKRECNKFFDVVITNTTQCEQANKIVENGGLGGLQKTIQAKSWTIWSEKNSVQNEKKSDTAQITTKHKKNWAPARALPTDPTANFSICRSVAMASAAVRHF